MEKNRIFGILNKALIVCAASLLLMSFSSSQPAQKTNRNNRLNTEEVGISDSERNRIFITMNGTFKDEEKCRIAMETIVNDAHAAYGVNSHFWFISEDGKSFFVLEQYEDKKAVRKAIRRLTSARISFFKSIEVIDVTVHGSISTSSKMMFAAMSPKYMNYYGGFSKNVTKTEEPGIKNLERSRILVASNTSFTDEEKCKAAMEEIVEEAHAEPGTNSHFWCTSKDGMSLFVLEQYTDEKALIDHLLSNPHARTAFIESIEMGDVTVYGTVSEKVIEMLKPINPTYMNYYGGYSK